MNQFQRILFRMVSEMRTIKRNLPQAMADVYRLPEFKTWNYIDRAAYIKILIDNSRCEPQKRFCDFICSKAPELEQWYEMLLSDEEFFTKVWHELIHEENNREPDSYTPTY